MFRKIASSLLVVAAVACALGAVPGLLDVVAYACDPESGVDC